MSQFPNGCRVAVLSAHQGADIWIAIMKGLDREDGISVDFVSSYDDKYYRSRAGVFSKLVWRLKTYLFFPLYCLFWRGWINRSFDVAIVITSPFFLPVLVARVLRIPVVTLQNDIFPEALVNRGLIRRDGFLDRFYTGLLHGAIKRVHRCVFIVAAHIDYFVSKGLPVDRAMLIPVGAVDIRSPEDFAAMRAALPDAPQTRILYCGTLGLMHEIDTFVAYAGSARIREDVDFVFRLSGSQAERFQKALTSKAPDNLLAERITLGGSLASEDWLVQMKQAHVGLIFQATGAGSIIFPSKMYSALSAGQAILAIANADSDAARIVHENACGWVVEPGDYEGLRRAVDEMADKDVLSTKMQNAYTLARNAYSIDAITGQWLDAVRTAPAAALRN